MLQRSEPNLQSIYLSENPLTYPIHSFPLSVMQIGPYSPDAKVHVPTSLDPWTKLFPVENSQSDSESSHYRFMSPEYSSGSSEGTGGDNSHIPDLPPQFRESARNRPLSWISLMQNPCIQEGILLNRINPPSAPLLPFLGKTGQLPLARARNHLRLSMYPPARHHPRCLPTLLSHV